jgi:hypothetical protein
MQSSFSCPDDDGRIPSNAAGQIHSRIDFDFGCDCWLIPDRRFPVFRVRRRDAHVANCSGPA